MKGKIIFSIVEKLIKNYKSLIKLALENGNVSDSCKIKIDDMIKNILMSEDLEGIESQLSVIKQILDLNDELLQGIILYSNEMSVSQT